MSRRGPYGRTRLGALVALALLALVAAAPGRAAPLVGAVDAVGLTVADMERSVAFYTEVLGFTRETDLEVGGAPWESLTGLDGARLRIVRLRLGNERLELTEYLAPRGRPIPPDSRSHDRWFQHVAIIVRDMDRAYAALRRHRVPHVSSGPQELPAWNPQAGGIRAFYFQDPDGHPLEILQFPPGKGDPKWHRPGDGLFLGIDHTAIVVADTEQSLAFYRDLLGMRVAGESENWGTEQEHLNAVFGARLRITALRAAAGPGIELLEYLAPQGGRPIPADLRPNDLAHWRTRLRTADLPAATPRLRAARVGLVSPAAVALDEPRLEVAEATIVRDPDGHALELAR